MKLNQKKVNTSKTGTYSLSYYLARNQTNIQIRERVEDAWKTLVQIIFYSLVILSIPFFINDLADSRLYYFTYMALLFVFLIAIVTMLNIKQETDRLIFEK